MPAARKIILSTCILFMGLFSFRKSSPVTEPFSGPYKDEATNVIYNLLFCDNPGLYKAHAKLPLVYPFDILLAEKSTPAELLKIASSPSSETRASILAYNRLTSMGHKPGQKELLGVIVEVGLDEGLDVVAAYKDGSARYINYTGKIVVWETKTEASAKLTKNLFAQSEPVLSKIGPWNQPRRPHPAKGMARITFLVSDGIYFGEGPVDAFFNDPMAGPVLNAAAEWMKYLTEQVLRPPANH
jgi:hypothetical protein